MKLTEICQKGVKMIIIFILIIGMILAAIGLTIFEIKMGHVFWPAVTCAGFMTIVFAAMHL